VCCRISRIVSDAVSTNTAENVEVVWIRARSASTAGTVIEQWSKYKFVALIGSMGRCATQLELAASLNLTAFTWVCKITNVLLCFNLFVTKLDNY